MFFSHVCEVLKGMSCFPQVKNNSEIIDFSVLWCFNLLERVLESAGKAFQFYFQLRVGNLNFHQSSHFYMQGITTCDSYGKTPKDFSTYKFP